MKEKLLNEEVLRVAKLAKLSLSEEEIEKYQFDLFKLIEEIDKIKEVKTINEEMMIAPFFEKVKMRSDRAEEESLKLIDNAPAKTANMVEVPVMINE